MCTEGDQFKMQHLHILSSLLNAEAPGRFAELRLKHTSRDFLACFAGLMTATLAEAVSDSFMHDINSDSFTEHLPEDYLVATLSRWMIAFIFTTLAGSTWSESVYRQLCELPKETLSRRYGKGRLGSTSMDAAQCLLSVAKVFSQLQRLRSSGNTGKAWLSRTARGFSDYHALVLIHGTTADAPRALMDAAFSFVKLHIGACVCWKTSDSHFTYITWALYAALTCNRYTGRTAAHHAGHICGGMAVRFEQHSRALWYSYHTITLGKSTRRRYELLLAGSSDFTLSGPAMGKHHSGLIQTFASFAIMQTQPEANSWLYTPAVRKSVKSAFAIFQDAPPARKKRLRASQWSRFLKSREPALAPPESGPDFRLHLLHLTETRVKCYEAHLERERQYRVTSIPRS